ncbi:MAG: HisS family protein [Isosphaeraceae bacterium]
MSVSSSFDGESRGERAIDAVRGTADWLPTRYARLHDLEALLLDRFARAGYQPLRTPVLEPTDLHERKSGAGIVSKLFELSGAGAETGQGGVCLRPELTAGIVRAYTAMEPEPALPWRVSHSGVVFRYESPRPDRLREFHQVGVERLGDGGALADAEVIWLADWAMAEAGVRDVSIRIGHVGLILEMLRRSGLPAPLGAALVERLSEAAAEGEGVHALGTALDQLSGWLRSGSEEALAVPESVERSDDAAIDRLFRTLVPVVTGRRTSREIVHRLRRKWDLAHGLIGTLSRVQEQVQHLAGLTGRPSEVLDRLGREIEALAPDSVAALRAMLDALEGFGVDGSRLTLDLGFGRGIGFYSQMIFEITACRPDGQSVEIGGGGRYDGLARVLGSGRDDRGVGFDFGLERLESVIAAQAAGRRDAEPVRRGILVAADPGHVAAAAQVATRLRSVGATVWLEPITDPAAIQARAELLGAARSIRVAGTPSTPGALTLVEGPGKSPTTIDVDALAALGRASAASDNSEGSRR